MGHRAPRGTIGNESCESEAKSLRVDANGNITECIPSQAHDESILRSCAGCPESSQIKALRKDFQMDLFLAWDGNRAAISIGADPPC